MVRNENGRLNEFDSRLRAFSARSTGLTAYSFLVFELCHLRLFCVGCTGLAAYSIVVSCAVSLPSESMRSFGLRPYPLGHLRSLSHGNSHQIRSRDRIKSPGIAKISGRISRHLCGVIARPMALTSNKKCRTEIRREWRSYFVTTPYVTKKREKGL